jgi:hypothetical protein
MMIQPIETQYCGYRFRSRLEARWAVFFNCLDLKFEYEPECYETSAGLYVPDFLVTNRRGQKIFYEIKPSAISRCQKLESLQEKCWKEIEDTSDTSDDYFGFELLNGDPYNLIASSDNIFASKIVCPSCFRILNPSVIHSYSSELWNFFDAVRDGIDCETCDYFNKDESIFSKHRKGRTLFKEESLSDYCEQINNARKKTRSFRFWS